MEWAILAFFVCKDTPMCHCVEQYGEPITQNMITADQLKDIQERAEALHRYLDIDHKRVELEEEELRTQAPDFWDDPARAQEQMKKVKGIEKWIVGYKEVRQAADELQLAFDFYHDDMVTEEEVDEDYRKAITAIENLELMNMLRQKEDPMDCVLKINSGAGGTESQDWASMLMRMYMRWAESNGYKVSISNIQDGDEAGIKSVTMEIEGGEYAYGYLKSENGVHRLVRLSPFNAESRETSFALVEVLPDIDRPDDIQIDDKDLRVDIYRSGGKGGQGVNTTDSAVRLTHLPTGIVVTIQNERSQIQNKAKAMEILRGKLATLQQEQHVASLDQLRAGDSASWGAQIRNYILHPYRLVKDTSTKHEEKNVDAVLGGNLRGFQLAYLESQLGNKNKEGR